MQWRRDIPHSDSLYSSARQSPHTIGGIFFWAVLRPTGTIALHFTDYIGINIATSTLASVLAILGRLIISPLHNENVGAGLLFMDFLRVIL